MASRTSPDLTHPETHFAFGKNWAEYATKITEAEIEEAARGLSRLLGLDQLQGTSFLDIGSGSGLHSLAAIRLGAAKATALDIDSDSVGTTRALLEDRARGRDFRVMQASILDLTVESVGHFDIVYSWGVLHHTGDMGRAIRQAADLVRDNGVFAFALYRRVMMDWFWRWEKRWYSQASPSAQARARVVYVTLLRASLRLTGRNLADYKQHYSGVRGMDFYHDVHDWMGGWPYESISPPEVREIMTGLGFSEVRSFALDRRRPGFFGSGCDEYVFVKDRASEVTPGT